MLQRASASDSIMLRKLGPFRVFGGYYELCGFEL